MLFAVAVLLVQSSLLVDGFANLLKCGTSNQWVAGAPLLTSKFKSVHGQVFSTGGNNCILSMNPNSNTVTAGQSVTITVKSPNSVGFKVESTGGTFSGQDGRASFVTSTCINWVNQQATGTVTWTAPASGSFQIRALCVPPSGATFIATPLSLSAGGGAGAGGGATGGGATGGGATGGGATPPGVPGTDFDFEFPANAKVKIFSKTINDTHLKIRMNYTEKAYTGFGQGTKLVGSTVILGMDPVVNVGSAAVGVYKIISDVGTKNSDILQNVAVTPAQLKAIGITETSFISSAALGSSLTFTLELAKQLDDFTIARSDQATVDLITFGGPANANGAFCKNNICFKPDNASVSNLQISFALGPDTGNGIGGENGVVAIEISPDLSAHIITMLLGWGILIPLGIVIPLFNNIKYSPTNTALCGISGPNWVKHHWILISLGLILTYVGTITGMNSVGGDHYTDAHGIIGLILLIGTIPQPIVAFLRPDKTMREGVKGIIRKTFDSTHVVFGYFLVFLAIAENLIGVQELFDIFGGLPYNLLGLVGDNGFGGPLGLFTMVISAAFLLLLTAGLLRGLRTKLLHGGDSSSYQNIDDKNGYPMKQTKQVFITYEELATHNSAQTCWMVYKGKVYDVTAFLNSHPGGKKVMMPYAGKDMTQAYDEAGHSADANAMLPKYCIGELKQNNRRTGSLSQRISARFQDFRQFAGGMMANGFDGARISQAVSRFSSDMRNGGLRGAYNGLTVRPESDPAAAFRFLRTNSERKRVVLTEKIQMSHNTYYFKFSLPNPQLVLGLPTGKHIVVYAPAQPGTQRGKWNNQPDPEANKKEISRKFTPVTADDTDVGYFALVVKVYRPSPQFPDGGRISRYFENLRIGQTVEISGPVGSHQYVGMGRFIDNGRELLFNTCGMVAGGSGITPVLQIASAMLRNPRDNTRISLIYANTSVDDILMKEHLDLLERQYPNRFRVWYTVSQDPRNSGNPMYSYEWKYSVGRVSKSMFNKRLPQASSNSVVIHCGPKAMMDTVNKLLREMGYPEERVIEY